MNKYIKSEYLVETSWLEENLGKPSLRIFDCAAQPAPNIDEKKRKKYPLIPINAFDNYQKAHIPDAVYIDVPGNLTDESSDIPMMAPHIEQAAEYFSSVGIDNDSRVVLYSSANFIWAARVWWLLKAVGFEQVSILNGGLSKWVAENRPITDKVSLYPTGQLDVTEVEVFVDKEKVKTAIDDTSMLLIHALTPGVYDGSNNNLVFGRRGHIPKSINIPSESLLDKQSGSYLPGDELVKLFEANQCDRAKEIITYCGGGVNASALAFSLCLAGYDNVSIYDGSMNEWGNDISLPVEI